MPDKWIKSTISMPYCITKEAKLLLKKGEAKRVIPEKSMNTSSCEAIESSSSFLSNSPFVLDAA